MKKFKCVKEVLAKPMTRGEYNAYRGWAIPDTENPEDEGYLVEYPDSPSDDMPHGHKCYISWSPKEVFEKGYYATHTYHERLSLEYSELVERIPKLFNFITADESPYHSLDTTEQLALRKQYTAMTTYALMLAQRMQIDFGYKRLPLVKVEYNEVKALVALAKPIFTVIEGTSKTTCDLQMPNGYLIGSGESNCINPDDFNKELGEQMSYNRAVENAIQNTFRCEAYARVIGYTA